MSRLPPESAVQTLQGQKIEKTSYAPANHRTQHITQGFFLSWSQLYWPGTKLGFDLDNSVEKVLFEALLRGPN
jgi:hypothetical protein